MCASSLSSSSRLPLVAAISLSTATAVVAARPVAAGGASARGLGIECVLVTPDLIALDGMLDDWEGIDEQRRGAIGARCAQTDDRLVLAITVRDDTIVRTSARPRSRRQDQLRLAIGTAGTGWSRLLAMPGTRGFTAVRRWRGRPADERTAADSLQPFGWALELSVPLRELRGWGRGTPKLRYLLEYHDRGNAPRAVDTRVAGTLRFAGATEVYRAFMRQTKLARRDVRADVLADIDGVPGVERVIVGGTVIGVLSDEYRYLTLPIQSAADLLAVQVVDLAGEGRSSVLTHYRERGNGGSRDVVAVWNVQPDHSFARTLAVEVRKQMGDRVIEDRWRLVPAHDAVRRGRHRHPRRSRRRRTHTHTRRGGFNLVVEAASATGWDEHSFDDVPPEDMRPILLPWGAQTSAVYTFEGGEARGGGPLP